jgi:hypothetical protein
MGIDSLDPEETKEEIFERILYKHIDHTYKNTLLYSYLLPGVIAQKIISKLGGEPINLSTN